MTVIATSSTAVFRLVVRVKYAHASEFEKSGGQTSRNTGKHSNLSGPLHACVERDSKTWTTNLKTAVYGAVHLDWNLQNNREKRSISRKKQFYRILLVGNLEKLAKNRQVGKT